MTKSEAQAEPDGGDRTEAQCGVAAMPSQQLETEIVALAQRLSAGTYELLVLVGELDARGGWAEWGALSCAAWLAEVCDVAISTAHTQVRVARAMRRYGVLDAAMASGDVSYAKARALVPHLTEDNADVLVDLATVTPASRLGAAIAAWSHLHEDPVDIDRRHQAERSVSWRTDADGMVTITARLAPADAGRLCAAIDQRVRSKSNASAGASLRQQRADALVALAIEGGGGVDVEVVVHVRGDEPATLVDGTPLSDHAVGALLPDAFVSLLVYDMNDQPIDASPRRRHPTRRQQRVVDEVHPECAHPGCHAQVFLQYDHIQRYTDDGPTTLDNLQRLCGPHNRARELLEKRPA